MYESRVETDKSKFAGLAQKVTCGAINFLHVPAAPGCIFGNVECTSSDHGNGVCFRCDMASGSRDRIPPLSLVPSASMRAGAESSDPGDAGASEAAARELDWSILMARAQGGDGEAYRRLLIAIAP